MQITCSFKICNFIYKLCFRNFFTFVFHRLQLINFLVSRLNLLFFFLLPLKISAEGEEHKILYDFAYSGFENLKLFLQQKNQTIVNMLQINPQIHKYNSQP